MSRFNYSLVYRPAKVGEFIKITRRKYTFDRDLSSFYQVEEIINGNACVLRTSLDGKVSLWPYRLDEYVVRE